MLQVSEMPVSATNDGDIHTGSNETFTILGGTWGNGDAFKLVDGSETCDAEGGVGYYAAFPGLLHSQDPTWAANIGGGRAGDRIVSIEYGKGHLYVLGTFDGKTSFNTTRQGQRPPPQALIVTQL